ncbi:type II toxin-antitoxin system VapC family toxin [Serinicoccus marinus]|uniref:type II toxin-antitoxin system VapC family toxin n=1 Tax=Serinicoccus marinus TaxID=247333 RepID=UPI0024908777|nr:type II toxin-antitoxin system VapC family toxin [Serinicoccus marinus]
MAPMQRRVLELRHNATAYDAFYVALAEALGMRLLTDDQKFARARGGRGDVVSAGERRSACWSRESPGSGRTLVV